MIIVILISLNRHSSLFLRPRVGVMQMGSKKAMRKMRKVQKLKKMETNFALIFNGKMSSIPYKSTKAMRRNMPMRMYAFFPLNFEQIEIFRAKMLKHSDVKNTTNSCYFVFNDPLFHLPYIHCSSLPFSAIWECKNEKEKYSSPKNAIMNKKR